MVLKTCRSCKKDKPYSDFLRKVRGVETIGKICDQCIIENDSSYSNPRYWREYKRKRRREDSLFRFKERIRTLIYDAIVKRGKEVKNSKSFDILGCTAIEFRKYIENQFTGKMNWNNIHLDHIKPISLARNREEVFELNHYTNFQPLLAIDNLKKGNKYNG